jgi:NAD(P)-dependent dehydrogenase (short-subunit alcohol dehydrogenase family)
MASQTNQSKLIVLITGANQGVGYATAVELAKDSNYHVLLSARDLSKAQTAVSNISKLPETCTTLEPIQLDVTLHESVTNAVSYVKNTFGKLDVLLNNAGINSSNPDPVEALIANLSTNVTGSVRCAELFLPLLRASQEKRLIFVGSSTGSLTHASDPNSPYYGSNAFGRKYSEYRASKAAIHLLMIEYDKKLRDEGFKVCVADPGLVITNLVNAEVVRARGAPEADVAGKFFVDVIRGERDADVGRVCGRYGVQLW